MNALFTWDTSFMGEDFDEIEDFDNDLDLTLYADPKELVNKVLSELNALIATSLTGGKNFHLALTGGTLGSQLTRCLVEHWNSHLDQYAGLHIWFSDERFVSSDSPERNAAATFNSVKNSNVVIHGLLGTESGDSIQMAVSAYADQLSEITMDLTILGLGPDGHVASLFPGNSHLDRLEKVIAIEDSPKPPPIRATFTMAMINASTAVWIIAAGVEKAIAVTKIIEGDLSIPASYIRAVEYTRLIVDTEAFFSE
jgi:6-phosphogluconolactonase